MSSRADCGVPQRLHTLQIQSLQGRLVQALAENRQLQLLSNEHEQSAHALKLQLDAATACDSGREAQLASTLSAAAALQEERAALQQARENALLQGARAAAAAEAAELLQSKYRASESLSRDALIATELQQCAAQASSPSPLSPPPLTRSLAVVKSGMSLSKYMRGGNSPHPPHDRHCRLLPLLVFGQRAMAVRSASPGLPAAVSASLGARGSNALGCSFTIVGRDVTGGVLGGSVREAAVDRVLVFTAAEQQQAKAWLVALRALAGCAETAEPGPGA